MADLPTLPHKPNPIGGGQFNYKGKLYASVMARLMHAEDCASVWKAIALEAMKYGEHKLPCLATDDATNPACKVVPCHCGWSALQAHVEEQA